MNEYTTTDYLNQLEQDREDLVNNLETQGITGLSGDETFTELVPEVLNISGGGADLSEYFSTTLDSNRFGGCIKKMPDLTANIFSLTYAFSGYGNSNSTVPNVACGSNVSSLDNCFRECKCSNIDISGWTFAGTITAVGYMFYNCSLLKKVNASSLGLITATSLTEMFGWCTNLEEIDLSNLEINQSFNTSNMFDACSKLNKLDIGKLDLTNISSYNNMFSSDMPSNALILVKDQASKTWMNTNFSRLTNVQIKSEYLANQA